MILGLVAAGLVAFGFGSVTVRQFESAAAADIRSRLEGPAHVTVKTTLTGLRPLSGDIHRVTISASRFSTPQIPLFTEPERSQRGILRELRIELSDFSLAGLRVERLEAVIPDCRFDLDLALRRKQMRVSRSGVGTGEVTILAADLERFLVHKIREIKEARIRLEDDLVQVEGYGEFVIVKSEFKVTGRLYSPDGSTIELRDAEVSFRDRPADELSRKVLLEALNPIVDLDRDLKLFGAVRLQGMRLHDNVLRAWGATQIPVRPPEQK
jgi:hypothetical protein